MFPSVLYALVWDDWNQEGFFVFDSYAEAEEKRKEWQASVNQGTSGIYQNLIVVKYTPFNGESLVQEES